MLSLFELSMLIFSSTSAAFWTGRRKGFTRHRVLFRVLRIWNNTIDLWKISLQTSRRVCKKRQGTAVLQTNGNAEWWSRYIPAFDDFNLVLIFPSLESKLREGRSVVFLPEII